MAKSHDKAKFEGFDKMIEDCKNGKIDIVVIAYPWVLGDDYEEIIESLSCIADAGVQLAIASRSQG